MTTMHKHSLEAYHDARSSKARFSRAHLIIKLMLDGVERTDNEIAKSLGFDHKSSVQPRISDLVIAGTLMEIGSMRDPVTNKLVRIVGIIT